MKELEAPDEVVIWFSKHAALGLSFDCIYSEALKKKSLTVRRAMWRGVLALHHPCFLDGVLFFFGSPLII